jgi:hypothetical protein
MQSNEERQREIDDEKAEERRQEEKRQEEKRQEEELLQIALASSVALLTI